MGIEVVHYKNYFFYIWVHDINEVFYLFCPVRGSTVFSHTDMMSASKRFDKSKYTADAIPDIFRIYFLIISWTHGQWFPCIAQ